MERWAAGDLYEVYMGRWSRALAAQFLAWLHPAADASRLDVGCSTGALTHAAATDAPAALTVGLDSARSLVEYAHERTAHARFTVGNALALPFVDAAFDYVLSGLMLNFVPAPEQALREWVRVAKPGGVVATYVWDYAGRMEFLRYFWDAAIAVDSNAKPFHEGKRFPLCAPEPLQQLWHAAALTAIEVQPLEIATHFADFEAYWQPFTVGDFPAPHYVASLDAHMRENVRAQLRGTLPFAEDGSLSLIARAWAVRGTKTA